MSEKTIAYGGTAFLALVLAYFKALAVPVIMLAVLMLLDYISGVIEAWVHNTMSSRVGIIGIVKKLCYALVVVVAIVIDLVIQYAAGQVGFDLTGVYCFGLLVTIWLIFNESISILENVAEIGGPEVPFLGKLLKHLKNTTEKKAEEAIPEGERIATAVCALPRNDNVVDGVLDVPTEAVARDRTTESEGDGDD